MPAPVQPKDDAASELCGWSPASRQWWPPSLGWTPPSLGGTPPSAAPDASAGASGGALPAPSIGSLPHAATARRAAGNRESLRRAKTLPLNVVATRRASSMEVPEQRSADMALPRAAFCSPLRCIVTLNLLQLACQASVAPRARFIVGGSEGLSGPRSPRVQTRGHQVRGERSPRWDRFPHRRSTVRRGCSSRRSRDRPDPTPARWLGGG